MVDVYGAWKPLRNYLRTLDLHDALGVIRYYSARRALKTNPPVPIDIELHSWADKETSFLPWELEALAREVVISSEYQATPRNSLKRSHDMAFAMNKMKDLENYIEEHFITAKNIRHDVSVRLSHRQFKYQTDRPSVETMVRYSKIFGRGEMGRIIERKLGLRPKQLFTLGAGLWSHFSNMYGIRYPLERLEISGVTRGDYDQFLSIVAKPLDEIRQILTSPSEWILDESYFYRYHSLYAYPIIEVLQDGNRTHVCPIPTLLYWRITSGLYYDLYKEKGFDNAFGGSFETYVGEILKAQMEGSVVRVLPGEENTGRSPNRCDWVIDQPEESLIIECKTKRLTMGAKTQLLSDDELFRQLGILGDAITQAYLSLDAYEKELFEKPRFVLKPDQRAYVAVTTLEKWHLMGEQIELLDEIVKEKLTATGLEASVTDQYPYVVMPIDDLEKIGYLSRGRKFSDILQPYIDSRRKDGWEFASYLHDAFGKELREYIYPFHKDIASLFTVSLDEASLGTGKRGEDEGV